MGIPPYTSTGLILACTQLMRDVVTALNTVSHWLGIVFDFNSSPMPMLWKIPLGYEILNSCSPHGHWNFSVFLILLIYMAMMKFIWAIYLQIQIGQMAVLENI